jgi:hypothetical protein
MADVGARPFEALTAVHEPGDDAEHVDVFLGRLVGFAIGQRKFYRLPSDAKTGD